MQREILFKAKRIDGGGWEYFGLFEKWPKESCNPDTICQYVGINDKNGNKIFEFDRVKDDVEYTVMFGNYWVDGLEIYGFYLERNSDKGVFGEGDGKYLEIIGNIHD